MIGESPGPERERAPIDISALRNALYPVIDVMRDHSHHSGAAGAHNHIPETLLEELRLESERANGALIEAVSQGSSYFYTETFKNNQGAESEVFAEGRILPGGKDRAFYGVQRGVEEIVVSAQRRADARYLCMAIDPLYTLFDHNVNSYMLSRGRENTLNHPFGVNEHARERLWVPVYSIKRGTFDPLHLPVARLAE